MSGDTVQTREVLKLVAYLRRQGGQCNAQQPIVPVAGSELLKAADAIASLTERQASLERALASARAAIASVEPAEALGMVCVPPRGDDDFGHEYPIRDELLSIIDAALSKVSQ